MYFNLGVVGKFNSASKWFSIGIISVRNQWLCGIIISGLWAPEDFTSMWP